MTNRIFALCSAFALLAFFAVFLFLPLYTVLAEGLDTGVFVEICRNQLYLSGLLNSFLIAVLTTAMVFLIALPLALLYDRYDFPGKGFCSVLMMIPMILPPFVGALGFQQILGYSGVLNSVLTACGLPRVDFLGGDGRFWAVCVIEALHLYPILYLNLISALANIDPSLPEAARNAGATALTCFRKITLPLLRPGILAGGSIVLIWSFTELGTPLMFGFNTVTPVQIFNGITELESNPATYTLVIIMLAVSCLLYLGGRVLLGGTGATAADSQSKGAAASRAVPLHGFRSLLPPGLFWGFAFFSSLPHLALVLTASSSDWYGSILPLKYTLDHFRDALSSPLVLPSIVNSLRYSLIALGFALLIGLLTAFLTQRSTLRFRGMFDLFAMLPLMIPGIVMAVGFLGMSVRYAWAGAFFDPVNNPVLLIAAAYAIRRIPYVLRSVTAGLEQTPIELENAARNAGAGAWRSVWKITLPLIAANLMVGGLFAFSFSMLEVSDSLILAQKSEFYPITKAIYELSQYLGSGPYIASAFGVWAMCFLACTLIAASVMLGRKMGSLFRL